MTNPFHNPEEFGLTILHHLGDPRAFYNFDDLVVWLHEDGRLFWATDAGDSYSTPFEYHTTIDNLNPITDADWQDFADAVSQHCSSASDHVEVLVDVARRLPTFGRK